MLGFPASPSAANAATAGDAANIFDVTMLDFQSKVLMASLQKPVLAYFTASWCGPCKQLRPALEKIVQSYGGKIALARIDIDQSPELAQAMRIQSVPQVYAFIAGQPADGFMGVIPDSQIKQFIDRVLKMMGDAPAAAEETETVDESADPFIRARYALEDGNPVQAIADYREALQADDKSTRAQTGIAFVESLMKFAAPGTAPQNPVTADDHYAAAMAAIARGDLDGGIAALLTSIKQDRKASDEIARQQLIALFDMLGAADPRVLDARRKLSAILFS